MSNQMKDGEEFYIGWMAKAPAGFAVQIKRYMLVILVILTAIAILLALSQKKFATGNFEFGKLTTIKGIYYDRPVPNIRVLNGSTVFGEKDYITVPLVGFGKSGAEGVMKELGEERGITLDRKEVALKGTLFYNDGKLLMQVDANDKPLMEVGKISTNEVPAVTDQGNMKIKGEIVDPKCFFGVMKPGMGKVHKDCAIRCILGGIPPVLRVINEKGDANYYFIVGAKGEKINERVKNLIAEPVEVNARVEKYDDWIVLYLKEDNSIQRISGLSLARGDVQSLTCAKKCNN